MPVPDPSELRQRFPIATQITEARIQFAIDIALSDVEDAIGTDIYNEIFAGATSTVEDSVDDTDTTVTNEEATRERKVTNAIYYKSMANLLENVNVRLRAEGSIKTEQDSASPGAGSKQVVNVYLSPAEIKEMRESLEAKASAWLEPYLIHEEVNTFVEYALVRG